MKPVPGLRARIEAVLDRPVQPDESIGQVLVELLERLEDLLQDRRV